MPAMRGRASGSTYWGGRGGKVGPRDTCWDCQLVGHWQGDPGCPAGVVDPIPPGTG